MDYIYFLYELCTHLFNDNLKVLEEELQQFTIQVGLDLKSFHRLNIINYGNKYAKFILSCQSQHKKERLC